MSEYCESPVCNNLVPGVDALCESCNDQMDEWMQEGDSE